MVMRRFFRKIPENRLITTQYFLAEWRACV